MAQDAKTLDLIAVGRSSVDLYGQQVGGRLEDMGSFAKYLGGSPTNTAAGGARLGLKTGLLTRVGADHMGRFIREQLEREGVDVAGVLSDPDRLTALVILGIRDRVNFPLIFYRENCADMALEPSDVDEAWFAQAGAVLINGTHLSQPNVYETSLKAARAVKAAGGRVAFDIDYRPVLWGLTGKDAGENRFVENQQVTAKLQEVVALCDLIVGTEEEIHILGGSTDTIAALRAIRRASDALLVCKRGPEGCVAFPGAIPDALDEGVSARGFKVEVFNVLGAGDAFMAGFLRGWLRHESVETCCEWGNACGAIVVSRHGCTPAMPTWIELQAFLSERERPFRLREDAELEHIHWATTRERVYDELTVLAIDHRSQFEDLIAETGGDAERIPDFKRLALRAVQMVAGRDETRFGMLLDGRFGFEALAEAADHDYWIARPIELPKSRPLEFECSADVATELLEWPLNQVVKCLAFYHPDDESDLRERQERQLLRLADACRKTRHELLLELILPRGMSSDSRTVARAIRRLYALGIRPDWWKLEPLTDPDAWREIEIAIAENDPLCRGVVLLGLSAPEAELVASFEVVAPFPIVKGFAVGRTIFYDVARAWLSNQIDDDAAVTALAAKFKVLVDAWRRLRGSVEKAA
ncbi:bifunctional 5-dehydro-2-deoxygluconokinase/5-dehydro-2-deoxyphosphogluconate aldolase [Caulobacter vibrioides]|uniref:IolC protein n=2 Tax=Caulobacter vibrioides TaxID=155892 RepID=Q9A8Q5_CAUVC|nr:5-dehydro-2-deoxygluconokinase [Caulobacter vibrioides]YP_002516729.1 5-dehydro-2-deoxygluconokinase IolC [Caulobacter vibrioides NA1000]AAK23279.1 iolC protein [Caulobacter vibrioides CB15]ACL94821.1 5-dehydro-2-deoxygluconokinase IolC [Caulobacter vibrioides NA1000]ATC28112.1 5-dehydro-2-deoxygluconokinase [Caulobacter vibrioides]QXZ53376.1 5-dehydro-2-deoxygluconokinase [Caulobacter vibrioides]